MAIVETSSTTPPVSPPGTERPQPQLAAVQTKTVADNAPVDPPTVSEPKASAPQQAAPPIGFSLHFDRDTQRMILEVRDPVSGYVIYQMPPKYVVKQFSASVRASFETARGGGVDKAV